MSRAAIGSPWANTGRRPARCLRCDSRSPIGPVTSFLRRRQLTRIEWKDKASHVRCFNFLFDNFKQFYLPHIFPDFNWHTNLYKPALSE